MNSPQSGFWDRLGISFSGLCAIHCMLAPVIASLIPLWPSLEEFNEYAHFAFILFIAPTVYLSLKIKHESRSAIMFMVIGLMIIIAAWFLEDILGEYGEAAVTFVGSGFLIRGHWLNYISKKRKNYEAA